MISAQKEGINSDVILNAYGITANTTIKIKVSDSEGNSIKKITNINHISAILNILSGKKDIGERAQEQRFADVWFETYGTTDVYYNGENMSYANDLVYETAHALWNSDQRQLVVELNTGYTAYFIYNPAIKTINTHSCYYMLTDEEVSTLNEILYVN